jgi:hypothetical protein
MSPRPGGRDVRQGLWQLLQRHAVVDHFGLRLRRIERIHILGKRLVQVDDHQNRR